MEVAYLALAGCGTALATGLGALPISHLGDRARAIRPALWGLTVGLMTVAAIVGLLAPAFREGSAGSVVGGAAIGVAFLFVARRWARGTDLHVGSLRGAGLSRSVLVFSVLFVHSLPEGLAIGTAYASDTEGLGLFVILAIALQNIPEGTTVAIPMQDAGFSPRQQFWAAVLTSAPQPIGALAAYGLVETIQPLLPLSFAFAAGAMLTLVLIEIVPEAFAGPGRATAIAGTACGAALMLGLAAALGV